MPCRQTYEVNKRELNKAAQRDQSYRNCLIALLIFFFLCLILILACVPWKIRSRERYNDEYGKHESQYHHEERVNGLTATTITENRITKKINDVDIESSTVLSKESKGPNTHDSYRDGKIQHITTASIESTDSEDSIKIDSEYDNLEEDETTTTYEVPSITSTQTTDIEASTSLNGPVVINKFFSNEYYSSKKSEVNMTTPSITTSTYSTLSTDLAKNATTNLSRKYTTMEFKDVTDFVTTSTPFAQPVTTNKYSSDDYYNPIKSEVNMTTQNITTSIYSTLSAVLAKNATTNPARKYTTTEFKDVTRFVTTSTLSTPLAQPVTTDKYFSDEYHSPKISEINMTIDNIVTSPDPMGDETTISTNGYVMSKTNAAADNVTSSLPIQLDDLEGNSIIREISKADVVTSIIDSSTDPGKSTKAQKSQSVATIIYDIIKTTISTTTVHDSEKDEHMKSSTHKQEKEFTTTRYDEMLNNNVTTRGNSLVVEDYTLSPSEGLHTTTGITNDPDNTTNVTASARDQNKTTEKYNENVTPFAMENFTYNNTYSSASYAWNTSPYPDEGKDICQTEHCKRTASKMLSYMNHLVDPCDDFYEYACGGFEANPQLIDGDLVRKTKNYQRIAKQMAKERRENMHSTFTTYYDSCVQYERTVNFNERVEMAINALKDVGEFYINVTWSDNYTDFTNLFVRLMLHHSALLFDIVPKFDEHHPTNFTLQISPPKYESPFMTGHSEDLCLEDEFETERQYVNLETLYANYKKCNKNTEEFLRSIKEALTVFRVFKGLNDSYLAPELQSQYIEKTVHDIDSIIIQGYFSYFPSKDKIQEVYAMNIYDKISLEGLQSNNMFINWKQLIRSLIRADMMEMNSIHNNDLHIYLYKELMNGLSKLEKFVKEDPMSLNNAIMALYAHNLYRELVLSRRNDVKDHCLQVTINLLRLEASNLYISSFTDHEIKKMDELIQYSFNNLKQTLRHKTEQIEWTDENGRNSLLEKVDNLKLSLPDLSYYTNRDSLYSDYNMSQIMLYNYFNNSMILLKRHRTLMYTILRKQTNQEKQIWAHYATPFQSKARVIYSLNVVVIPYGIIDWSSINEEHTLKYILLATLGNLIAHQIAHHFDYNGLYSWEMNKNIIYEDDVTNMNLDDYINCHKDNLYQAPLNFTLPLTEQTVSLTIPRLTLNERLSDIVGFRLAYDTLALTRSKAEKQLPWIKLSVEQLFYLAYAQMYCTKSPLTSSYVSLYESEDLPNRIRVFVSASHNKFVADEWNCPMGSQIAPNEVCSIFPYIETTQTV